jgi:hypothetical protein
MGWRRSNDDGPGQARPDGTRWITLSNHRHVLINDDGRIERGLPPMYHHVHVQDVAPLGRRVRGLEQDAEVCDRQVSRGRRTFRTTEEAVRALLHANPHLLEFLESECGTHCDQYQTWIRRGRRGPKPRPTYGDGRFDAIEVPLELHGARAISSWLEAVWVIPPPSRRWEDFPPRLQLLADATGLILQLPEEAEERVVGDRDRARCHDEIEARIDELIALARESRIGEAEPAPDEEVPF